MAEAPWVRSAVRKVSGLLVGAVRFHPRLFIALALGAAVFVAAAPWLDRLERFLIGFDVAAAAWILLAMRLVLACDAGLVRRRATRDDEGAWVALVVVLVVTATSLVAVVLEAHSADKANGTAQLMLAVGTLLLAWLFFHSLFAFHYAHEYYDEEEADAAPMLGFGGTAAPDYWDFLYFSFNFGTSSQTGDVSVNSPRLRRFVLLHQISSYIFNATVIALGVNVAAALM